MGKKYSIFAVRMMRYLIHISLLFAVLAGILAGCNRVPNYDERLVKADNLVYEHPDQAKDILLKINPKGLNEADAAYYNLLFTQASYINYDIITNDHLSMINNALGYYKKHNSDKKNLTRSYIYKGAVFDVLDALDSAMIYYKWAELYASENDHFNLGYAQLSMGKFYSKNQALDGREIEKLEQAVDNFRKAGNNHYLIISLKTLGTQYRYRDADKAEEKLKEAIDLAKREKDTENYIICVNNLAYMYFMQSAKADKDSADILLTNAYRQLQNILELNRLDSLNTSIYTTFTCVYANKGKVDSASIFLDMAKRSYGDDTSYNQSSIYLEAKSQIAKAKGNMLDYYRLSHESDSISFSTIRNPEIVNLMNAEIDCDQQYKEKQDKDLRKKRFIMAGFMLLLSLLALMFYRRSHRYDKLVLELKDQSRSQLNDLTDMQQNISELKINDERLKGFITSHMDMMREMIDACYHEPNNRIAENLKRIVKFQDSNRDNWVKLYDYIDLEHNNIMTRTREQYPQLNDKDLLLLALTCMGYSYIQTAIIMGYSNATSVSVLKQRLAKKMGLEGTLNEYIEQNSNVKIE